MTISTINIDNAYETFHYLPEEKIIECKEVSRQWKQMIEKNEKKLFSKDFLAIKGARDTFVRTRHLLEAVNREIETLEDFFANSENQVGLLEMGLSSFSFANEKCASYRDQMQERIEKIELFGKLEADSYRLSCTNRVELLTIKNFKNSPAIMQLFGGREEYNKLPILDISQIQPKDRDPIITPKDMEMIDPKASIMRGFDSREREFFTIKFNVVKGEKSEGPYCATVFELVTGGQKWIQVQSRTRSFWNNSRDMKPNVFLGNKELISTGRLTNSETNQVIFLA